MAGWFIRDEIYLIIGAFAAVVAYQLLTGRINADGLLGDGRGAAIAASKVQMLVATGGAVIAYVQQVAGADLAKDGLPEPTTTVLAVFGGSQLLHLGGLIVSATGGLRWPPSGKPRNSGNGG